MDLHNKQKINIDEHKPKLHKSKILDEHFKNHTDKSSRNVAILSFLKSLTKQGESIEIIDDSIYKFEKAGILKGLEQVKNGNVYSSDELLEELKLFTKYIH